MKKWIPILAILVCCMIWGTTFVAIKSISNKIDPFLLAFLRSTIASLVLFPIIIFSKHRSCLLSQTAIKYGFITGLILGGIYVLQTIGLKFTSSNHGAFISSSAVIIVPILLVLFGKEIINFKQFISIIIIFTGLYFLTNSSSDQAFNQGDWISFIAAFVCALHIIFSGYYVRKTVFLGLIFYQFLFSAIISLIGVYINYNISKKPIQFEMESLNSILYLGLLGTLFCFFVTVWAQKYVSTIFTALIFSLEPIFAASTSYVCYGETLSSIEIVGGIAIISGLYFYNLKTLKK